MKLTPSQKRTINGLLRELLVLRDGERCLRCKRTGVLHMSHIYPKGKHRRMEYMAKNLKFLCLSCHLYWWHRSPIEAWEWLSATLDKGRLQELKRAANTVDKSPFDYARHKEALEAEISRLRGQE